MICFPGFSHAEGSGIADRFRNCKNHDIVENPESNYTRSVFRKGKSMLVALTR